MSEQISKSELLDAIRSERERLEETLARLDKDQMTQPGVEGGWSVKDILAHITAWEKLMTRWVGQALRGDVPELPGRDEIVDQWNQRIYQENKDRPLAEVLEEFKRSYQDALRTTETTLEEDLMDPERFEWLKGAPLWRVVAANTWWHYKEHNESTQAWLESREVT
jgi:hypothetical protein